MANLNINLNDLGAQLAGQFRNLSGRHPACGQWHRACCAA